MKSIEAASSAHRKRAIAAARRRLDRGDDDALATALIGDLFGRVSVEDIEPYAAPELAGFARSAAALLAGREPGKPVIRIHDPDFDGRARRHQAVTVVEILNDNMPFLVDSIMSELQDSGAVIRLVAHPIVTVTRDSNGRLTDYRGTGLPTAGSGAARESLITVHVDRLAGEAARDDLAARLAIVLESVRLAVAGWQPMRSRLGEAIAAYRTQPTGLPEEETAEAIAFLEWLLDNNFTFLGMREYDFVGGARHGELKRADQPGLGILSDPGVRVLRRGREPVTTTPALRHFLMRPEALIITKTNIRSHVHRRVYMDYVGVKLFDGKGKLSGELRVVGLFTSTAYTDSTLTIPFLRRKVGRVLVRAGYDPEGHSGKALVNVLESYPRDELFQIEDEMLLVFAMEILALEERPRVRVLVRSDEFDRFVSIVVFVPRDRYDSRVRVRIGNYLAEVFEGRVSAYYPAFPEAMPLTRVHFIIGRDGGKTPDLSQAKLEAGIAALIRTWGDDLRHLLFATHNEQKSEALHACYAEAFPAAYRDDFTPEAAVSDIAICDALSEAHSLSVTFHPIERAGPGAVGLRLIHRAAPIALSERVPMLEAMGFRVIDERSYEIAPAGHPPVYIHEMALERADGTAVDLDRLAGPLTDCMLAVWEDRAESDPYNGLVLTAGLDWRQAALLRAISRYLRQTGTPFSSYYMAATLNRHAAIAVDLTALFAARFDPAGTDAEKATKARAAIDAALETVDSLDEDRIIRSFANAIEAMVRTNVFQRDRNGTPPGEISFKLDPAKLDSVPEPRPFREIFIHSPRVDGVHLRFGKVARGGIRWSDRPQDFRTEILGLVKAQQVKNAVIVPVGAKGGFVAKRLPAEGGREAMMAEGIAAYKVFIATLLALTDNLDGEDVVPPPLTVRHDDDDPYFVVAADKGTATFSDTANGIAVDRGFWLGDAFASGGSAGYDHKKMGITARGAWEAVKRHFREMDVDIQTTPFTVVGVGDMSGDVFGNGMLLSKATKLVAAFDHRDIFIDPDPDPAVSFAERKRLFDLPRSSWQDYDREKISAGGGVFSRRDKALRLSPEARALLGLTRERVAPHEVISAILRAEVDLLWFGGIGTYVKAEGESDELVGDRANDAVRITAQEIGARVVGEGANLGLTQRARIAYGLLGGRCNSDAIDNSAGVNTSDVEVNIKIAFRRALAAGRIDMRRRNRLLKAMTGEVASLVLRNNYQQTLAISLAERRGFEDFTFQLRLMQELEARGRLNRAVETLPDDTAMAERQKAGKPLTRAEIGVLLAYAKIVLFDDLLESDVVDDPAMEAELMRYFPERMRADWSAEIAGHRLHREIVATMLGNAMINRGGPTYITRLADRTGAGPDAIARAYLATRETFALRDLNGAIDALDNRISGDAQLRLYRAVQDLLLTASVWFLRNASFADGIAAVVDTFRPAVVAVEQDLDRLMPQRIITLLETREAATREAGAPAALARRIARLPVLAAVPDILLAAEAAGCPVARAAAVHFEVAEELHIGRIVTLARAISVTDYYDGLALDHALALLAATHRRITTEVLTGAAGDSAPFARWLEAHRAAAERFRVSVSGITEGDEISVARLVVAANLLGDLARP